MAKQLPEPQTQQRDGTSQAGRLLPALDPDYVPVDERSFKDLLAFTRQYAKELKYFDAEGRPAGTWEGFLDPEIDLDEVVAFMQEPEKFSPQEAPRLFRPHFALFLTFLKLLRRSQDQLNTLTRRHLEFFYQQQLRMTRKSAVPDRVNLILQLAVNVGEIRVSAGTLLTAGQDSQGQDRFYSTDRDIVVNAAQIERLSSIFADRRITGIREARERFQGPRKEGFLRMLGIALGDPLPGDPLRPYRTDKAVDYAFLVELSELVGFADESLFIEIFELRSLMALRQRRKADREEWKTINGLLNKAARKRDSNSALIPEDSRNFEANLKTAAGGAPKFEGITLVDDIYELYDQRVRQEVRDFIANQLYFEEHEDFVQMMQVKVRIDAEWKEINRILELAGRRKRKDPTYRLSPKDPTDFDSNLVEAVGSLDYSKFHGVGDIDQYYTALLRLEEYFFMSAESFALVMSVETKRSPAATDREWEKVYGILNTAHKKKIYASRRKQLKTVREDKGFDAMLYHGLGEDPAVAEGSPLERLKGFVKKDSETAFLVQVKDLDPAQISVEEWDRVYGIVELAQRIREGLPEPVPFTDEWLNLYPHSDARSVGVSLGLEDDNLPRWKTFGQLLPEPTADNPPEPVFGWALSSPLLALSEGDRTIKLTLGFDARLFDTRKIAPLFSKGRVTAADIVSPFRIEVSTEKGWIEPESVEVKLGDYQALSKVTRRIPDPLPAIQLYITS